MTEHFTFEELTYTNHSDLLEENRKEAKAFIKHLKYIAGTLEELRTLLGVPLKVTSGFRGYALNKAVGGSPTSGHTKGLCADIIPIGIAVDEAFKEILARRNECPSLRKCIFESVKNSVWLHIEAKVEKEQTTLFYKTTDGRNYSAVS